MATDKELNRDGLQYIYGLIQQIRNHHDKMETALREGKVVNAFEELKHCKTAISIQSSQVFQVAERLGIEIKTFPYKPDGRPL